MHMLLILLTLRLRKPDGISHLFSIAYPFAGNGCVSPTTGPVLASRGRHQRSGRQDLLDSEAWHSPDGHAGLSRESLRHGALAGEPPLTQGQSALRTCAAGAAYPA